MSHRFIPTERDRGVVQALLVVGIPLENICAHVTNPATGRPISYATLAKAFRKEIATSVEACNGAVASNLYRIASNKKSDSTQVVQAAVFWMRTRGGWRSADSPVVTTPSGDTVSMVENEETARAIMEDVLNKYGRRRLTG